MQRLFGKGKPKGPAPTLDGTAEKMDKRVTHLESRMKHLDAQLLEIKKQMQTTPKVAQTRLRQRAKMLLQQRKMLEQQWMQLAGQLGNIEQIRTAHSQIETTTEMVAVMKEGQKQLQKQMKAVDISKVETMQDDMQDMLADVQDLQDIMGRSYNLEGEVDEDELDAEFAALDEESVMSGLGEVETPSYLQEDPSMQALEAEFGAGAPATAPKDAAPTQHQMPTPAYG